MNLLLDRLQTSITVSGRRVALNTDYRYALRTITAFEDNSLVMSERYAIALANLLTRTVPEDARAEAVAELLKFINGPVERGEDDEAPQYRLYSFSKDAGYIYAAFNQTHGIDLESVNMHWWKFLTLFMDLGADTVFCQLVSLRKRVKSGQASKSEREAAREMGSAFDVPELDLRTAAERRAETEFMRSLAPIDRRQT